MAQEWEEIDGGRKNFITIGDGPKHVRTFEGVWTGDVEQGKYSELFVFKGDGGARYYIQADTDLKAKLTGEGAKHLVGRVLRLVYSGRKQTKNGKPMKLISVFAAPEITREMAERFAVEPAVSADEDDGLPF